MSKQTMPKLVVFDLDYTLWPFWVDTHVTPPFKEDRGKIIDKTGSTIKSYTESTDVLKFLTEKKIPIAVASRTSEVRGANQLIDLFKWEQYFKYKEIYPGCKVTHFKRIHEQSKVAYEDMVFFDDERRNIVDVSNLRVTCILVENGMTMEVLNKGLDQFREKKDCSVL